MAISIKPFGEEHESTADRYRRLGVTQHEMHDYTKAVQSHQRALAIRIKLFGEEHESAADSYCKLGVTQANMHDHASALQSHQRELAIRIKQFGEEHESTADSYRQLAVTQMNVLYTSQLFSPISVHLVYRKIVELLAFAWANIVTHLSQEFAFSQNLSALTIFQNRSQDATLISVLLNAFLTVSH